MIVKATTKALRPHSVVQFRPRQDRRDVSKWHVAVGAKTEPIGSRSELRNPRELHGLCKMVIPIAHVDRSIGTKFKQSTVQALAGAAVVVEKPRKR